MVQLVMKLAGTVCHYTCLTIFLLKGQNFGPAGYKTKYLYIYGGFENSAR